MCDLCEIMCIREWSGVRYTEWLICIYLYAVCIVWSVVYSSVYCVVWSYVLVCDFVVFSVTNNL